MKINSIVIENVYKEYKLGAIGRGTLYRDLQSFYAKIRGRNDPNSIIGMEDIINSKESILALNNISLKINHGDKIGIIGNNGAGKSTLLKLLSRITSPSRGVIKIKGRTASLLEVGTGFHPELTGRENIYLNGTLNGLKIKEIDSKLDKIIEFSQVEKFIDTPVKRYSTGMFVKLGFAVAAYLEPDILIVDEVLAVGDAAFREKAINKMSEFSKEESSTLIFVSHNMQSIRELCNRVLVIEKGELVFDGDTKKGIDKYISQTMSNTSNIRQLNFNDRRGGEKFKFTKIYFKDKNENNLTEIISGQKLILVLDYSSEIFIDKLSFLIDLRIKDILGYEISSLSSNEMGATFEDFKSEGKIKITIEKLMIRSGDYIIDIYSSIHIGRRKTLDNLMNACKFKILPSDYFHSGKNLSTNSIMILDSKIENL